MADAAMTEALVRESWAPVQARLQIGQIGLEALMQAWIVVKKQVEHMLPAEADRPATVFNSFAHSTVLPAAAKLAGAEIATAAETTAGAEMRASAAASAQQQAAAAASVRRAAAQVTIDDLVAERQQAATELIAAAAARADALAAAAATTERARSQQSGLLVELAECKDSVSALRVRMDVERQRAETAEHESAQLQAATALLGGERERSSAAHQTELAAVETERAVLQERAANLAAADSRSAAMTAQLTEQLGRPQ